MDRSDDVQDDLSEGGSQADTGENAQGVSQPGSPGRGARTNKSEGRLKGAIKGGLKGAPQGWKGAAGGALKGFAGAGKNGDDDRKKSSLGQKYQKGKKLNQLRQGSFKDLGKGAMGTGGSAGGAAGGAAATAGAGGAAASAPVWVPVLIVILIIIIVFMILMDDTTKNQEDNPLVITKTGPQTASAGDEIAYQIRVSYPQAADNIIIKDKIPPDTEYVSSVPPAQYDPANHTATWNLNELVSPITSIDTTLNVTVRVKQGISNISLINISEGTVVAPRVQDPQDPGGPPNTSRSDCGNPQYARYLAKIPLGVNFGDPDCTLSTAADRSKLYDQLKIADPPNANRWFFTIIPCESGYIPIAYNANSASGHGAYGLFQMNPAGKGNGQYDTGNVPWPQQVTNATTYGKRLSRLGAYWACAR